MSDIRCIIVEDEPLAARLLTIYIAKVPYLRLLNTFSDALSASDFLRKQPVDLIFLDIHLPKLKGLAFLKSLHEPPAVILTTAYHQYAVEAFSLHVIDYLVKPVEFQRFITAVNRLKATTSIKHEIKEHIYISVLQKKVKILFADILYIESQKDYLKVITTSKTYQTKMTTHEMETLLPPHRFKRIHRSFIISISKIDAYTSDHVELNGISIPVGKAYRDIIKNL